MGLPEIYAKYFGAKEAAEKKAEGEETAQAAEAQAAETKAESTGAAAEVSDEDLEKALSQMSEEDLKTLATEVAGDVREARAKEEADAEKVAEEYYAAGRIFAQGFMAEVKGTEKTAEPSKQTATQKFSALLEEELKKGAEKKADEKGAEKK